MNINIFNEQSEQDHREFVPLYVPEKYDEPSLMIRKNVIVYNHMLLSDEIMHEFSESFYYRFFLNMTKSKQIEGFNTAKTIEHKGLYFFATHPYYNNYSHFTLQLFGGLLFAFSCNMLPHNIKIIINKSSKFAIELIELFQKIYHVNYEYLEFNDKNIHIYENCIFVSTLFEVNYGKMFIKNFESFTKLLYKPANISTYKKIYITRLNNKNRRALNENDIIEFMRKKDFYIVDFDQISVLDQIHFINGADQIVAAHGASGANLLYALQSFKFTEYFSRNRFVNFHLCICSQKNCQYSAFVNNATRKEPKDVPYLVSIQLLEKALDTTLHTFQNNQDLIYNTKALYQKILTMQSSEYILKQEYLNNLKQGKFSLALDRAQKLFTINKQYITSLVNICRVLGTYHIALEAFNTIKKLEKSIPLNYIIHYFNLLKDQNQYNEIITYYNQHTDLTQHKDYLNRIIFLKNLPSHSIKTWHDTVITVDQDFQHLIHCSILENFDHLIICELTTDNRIALKINKTNQYVSSISSNGLITVDDNIHYFSILHNQSNLFGIKIDESNFLSVKPDGGFKDALYLREWELLKN